MTPKQLGIKAANNGKTLDDNPYDQGSEDYKSWLTGWHSMKSKLGANTQNYRKKGVQPMFPYTVGETLPDGCSVSEADKLNGSPKKGDMIAINTKDQNDTWLVASKFHLENYELAEPSWIADNPRSKP